MAKPRFARPGKAAFLAADLTTALQKN